MKEVFDKSLLISNKTAGQDPREDYRGWLRSTLFDLLERAKNGDEKAEMFIKTSINSLILWCEIENIKMLCGAKPKLPIHPNEKLMRK